MVGRNGRNVATCYDRIMTGDVRPGDPTPPGAWVYPAVDATPTIAKAVVATTGALATAITAALADGHVSVWEIVLGVLVAVGSGAATWAVSNKR